MVKEDRVGELVPVEDAADVLFILNNNWESENWKQEMIKQDFFGNKEEQVIHPYEEIVTGHPTDQLTDGHED